MTSSKQVCGIAACGLALITGTASAQTFNYTYDFEDVQSGSSSTSGSATGAVPELTFSAFSAAGVGPTSNASDVFSFRSWGLGADDDVETFSGALDLTKYLEFSITAAPAYTYSLSTLTFAAGRSSTGVRQFSVRSSLDGFASNLAGTPGAAAVSLVGANVFQFTDQTTTVSYSGNSITFDSAFSGLTSPLTFRFYGYNAETSQGTFRLDDVSVSGSLSAVPEPSTYAAWLGGLTLLGVVLRRRQQGRATPVA